MARDFIFRLKKGEQLPPRDPSGTRIIFNEDTKEFLLLNQDGSITKPPTGGGGTSNHSELNLNDGTNPHGTTKSDVDLANADNTSDLEKPISDKTQGALNTKVTKLDIQGFVGPNQEYQSIQEAIDDGKIDIQVLEDTTEPSNVTVPLGVFDFVINIPVGVVLDMGVYNITITDGNTQIRINCNGTIIWSPTVAGSILFDTAIPSDGVIFINNLNLNMTNGTANNCLITGQFITTILQGIQQIDCPDHNGCGYHSAGLIDFAQAFIVFRNLNYFTGNVYNCMTVNGVVPNIVFVGVFSNTQPLLTVNGEIELLSVLDFAGGVWNFDLNGGKIKNFSKRLLGAPTIEVNFNIIADKSEIRNVDLIGSEISNSTIDVGDLNNVYLDNVQVNSIINSNITTKQNAVLDLSFSQFAYNRNIYEFEVFLKNDLITTSTDMIDISELEINLEVGWYRLELVPLYNASSSDGTGWNFGNGTAVITNYSFVSRQSGTNATNAGFFRYYSSPNQDFSTTATSRVNNNRAYIITEFEVTSPGTIIPRFRTNSGNQVNLRVGTYLRYKKLNVLS